MTNEEAIKIADDCIRKFRVVDEAHNLAFWAYARKALEKQIPKKPIAYDSVPHTRCPSCKSAIRVFEDDPYLHFCRWCGQAIDWSEVE